MVWLETKDTDMIGSECHTLTTPTMSNPWTRGSWELSCKHRSQRSLWARLSAPCNPAYLLFLPRHCPVTPLHCSSLPYCYILQPPVTAPSQPDTRLPKQIASLNKSLFKTHLGMTSFKAFFWICIFNLEAQRHKHSLSQLLSILYCSPVFLWF